MAWGDRQRAMKTAQHWDSTAKNQQAEITMFQISEVQESPALTGRRSFLALRVRVPPVLESSCHHQFLSSPKRFVQVLVYCILPVDQWIEMARNTRHFRRNPQLPDGGDFVAPS